MAKRYSGNLQISVTYDDRNIYPTTVSSGGKLLWRGTVGPAPAGFGRGVAYDSPQAYDEIARTAIAFAEDEKGGIADEAEFDEAGSYLVRRSPRSSRLSGSSHATTRARDPLWYRWAVNYHDARGKIRQAFVDSTTQQDAIVAARVMHPNGRDFTATKLSTKPLS